MFGSGSEEADGFQPKMECAGRPAPAKPWERKGASQTGGSLATPLGPSTANDGAAKPWEQSTGASPALREFAVSACSGAYNGVIPSDYAYSSGSHAAIDMVPQSSALHQTKTLLDLCRYNHFSGS